MEDEKCHNLLSNLQAKKSPLGVTVNGLEFGHAGTIMHQSFVTPGPMGPGT